MTKEEMQELRTLMSETVKPIEEKINVLQKDVDAMKEDISIIKEESKITRHSTNLLLTWAEKADKSINIGLYEK